MLFLTRMSNIAQTWSHENGIVFQEGVLFVPTRPMGVAPSSATKHC
jgi:hypothetical protein